MYISSPNFEKPPCLPGLDRYSYYDDIWQRHWYGLRAVHDERFALTYGLLTGPAVWKVRKLISCGSYRNGIRRHACPDCGTELHPSVLYGCNAGQVWYRMRREYCLNKGYFRPMKRGP